ncbi:hypothetical protein M434DRAFT_401921 [Hypoxylon sp. CO27-5]|nr:hypothetical protein M434DRAFT_401921 [Hypoxylon sp. CO27-5]
MTSTGPANAVVSGYPDTRQRVPTKTVLLYIFSNLSDGAIPSYISLIFVNSKLLTHFIGIWIGGTI